MTSLKERMALFTKSARQSDADDHAEFKKKSGNTEQPEKVGKLNHSYLQRDSGANPKRNFKIPSFKHKEKEDLDVSASSNPSENKDDGKAVEPVSPATKKKKSTSARISTFVRHDMTGMLKNPFHAHDKKGKEKPEDVAAKIEEEEPDAEEDAENEEGEDQFAIPEEGEEGGEGADDNVDEKPRPGALKSFVKQSQRLSLSIFGKKKSSQPLRSQSENVDVMNSRARAGAGIRLHEGSSAPPPPKRISLFGMMGSSKRSNNNNKMNAYNLVLDKKRADEVEDLLNQISKFNPSAFTPTKRLSIRDNDIVQAMQKVIGNDPRQTEIKIDTDVRFSHLRSSLVQEFADSIRKNLYLKKLSIRGVELGNTFLESLAAGIRDNVTLQEIDLTRNSFTHDALVEFCQALELNHTITTVRLQTQMSPVYEKSIETVFEALEKNRSVKMMFIDFQGDTDNKYDKRLKQITQRNYWNKDNFKMPNPDDLLVNFLKEEVVRAEEQHQQQLLEKDLEEVREGDWDYLYELSVLFDKFKLQEDDDSMRTSGVQSFASPMHAAQSRTSDGFGTAGKNPLTGAQGFPSDGSFLTEEFIDSYLQEDPEKGSLVFNFCNQVRLFKQFPATSPDRETIVNIFVYELLHHPRQQEFTGINMTNTGCGNDFWEKISEAVLEDPDLLPNLNMISAETNFLTEGGIVAIANLIKSETSMRYLQIVKLDNQKALLSSKAERALARAMCVNLSIIRFSLRVRNLLERDQCNKYVLRNIDFLRQARRHYKINTGTLQERKRNAIEQYFDKIAANDESIKEVEISADIKFTGLSDVEKVKCAQAFATNSHVTKVTLNQLQLDDKFAIALGEALEKNETIERLVIEGNAFTGAGFKGIFAGLGKNSSVLELLGKHQTKAMSSPDEQELPKLLEGNTTITKISLDLRNNYVEVQLDKICNQNRHTRLRAEAPSERKRNDMEQFFDKIADDDETITEVNLSADVIFTGLSTFEKVKSAKAFATNSHVTKVTMNQLQLGDDFLIALGESLATNNTVERLVIEGNAFSGPGFKGLFTGLGKNSSVKELLGKHQTKAMSSTDEQELPAFIEGNTTISKISLDLRNSAVAMALDNICKRNQDRRRKEKSAIAGTAAVSAAAAVASTPANLRDSTAVAPISVPAEVEAEAEAEEQNEVPEEKPFDEEVPQDEAPMDEVVQRKAPTDESPFDERSVDQPFDEASPEDEDSPTEEVQIDESPDDEVHVDEEAPDDELPPAVVQEGEGEEIEVTAAPEAEIAQEEEEAAATPEDTPVADAEPEPEAPDAVEAGEGDGIEVSMAPQEETVPEDTPVDEAEPEPEAPDVVESGDGDGIEVSVAPEEETLPEEEEEPEPEAPAVVETGESEEVEVSAAPEPESTEEEEAPVAPEDAPVEVEEPEPEASATVEAEEVEVSGAPEPESTEEEEAPAAPEDALVEVQEPEPEASATVEAEEGDASAAPEPESTQEEDAPIASQAEEEDPEPEPPAAVEATEPETAQEEEAPTSPEDTPPEDEEPEPEAPALIEAIESETAQEEEAPTAPEHTPVEEKEHEAEAPAAVEAAEPETAEAPAATEDAPTKEEEPEVPAVVEAGESEEVEVNAAPEPESAPATSEDTPADEEVAEPAPADIQEEEVEASPAEENEADEGGGEDIEVETAQSVEVQPTPDDFEDSARVDASSQVEEIDGKSADSWDKNQTLDQ